MNINKNDAHALFLKHSSMQRLVRASFCAQQQVAESEISEPQPSWLTNGDAEKCCLEPIAVQRALKMPDLRTVLLERVGQLERRALQPLRVTMRESVQAASALLAPRAQSDVPALWTPVVLKLTAESQRPVLAPLQQLALDAQPPSSSSDAAGTPWSLASVCDIAPRARVALDMSSRSHSFLQFDLATQAMSLFRLALQPLLELKPPEAKNSKVADSDDRSNEEQSDDVSLTAAVSAESRFNWAAQGVCASASELARQSLPIELESARIDKWRNSLLHFGQLLPPAAQSRGRQLRLRFSFDVDSVRSILFVLSVVFCFFISNIFSYQKKKSSSLFLFFSYFSFPFFNFFLI